MGKFVTLLMKRKYGELWGWVQTQKQTDRYTHQYHDSAVKNYQLDLTVWRQRAGDITFPWAGGPDFEQD